MAVIKETF